MAFWNRKPRTALIADATILQGPNPRPTPGDETRTSGGRKIYRTPDEWQREVWDFYDSLGEFRQGITWKGNMLSRVRLRAAKIIPDQDEPQIVDTGPAHDIMRDLAGGVGGQAALMSSFAVYLDVPGECYLLGETLPSGRNRWYTRSIEEVTPQLGGDGFRVSEGRGRWRDLPDNSMVVRVWRPHKRWHNVADSPARACRPKMRELELINRHIQSQYMSRLASAGIVIFPDEVTFPVRAEFADAPDPFVAEWIEIAAEAIKTPGTAAAVVPIPIKVPGEYVDKVKHVDFTLKLDDKIIEKRDSALASLAIELDMPPEALLGTRNVNHWNAWLIDEQGVKVHVAPDAELVCSALTEGYLVPRLVAAGEDPDEWVAWYDASELILRPDRTEAAQAAYDRIEINGKALRRESGFDESDAPTDEERRVQILLQASVQPVNTFAAMKELGYDVTETTAPTAPRPPAEPPADQPPPANGPPDTQGPGDAKPPTAGIDDVLVKQLVAQAKLMHAVQVTFTGEWILLHPTECAEHLFSCPVTHATWKPTVDARPGTTGVYRCWLNQHGQPVLGERVPDGYARSMLASTAGNGHVRELIR
jgi:hypothetical protein